MTGLERRQRRKSAERASSWWWFYRVLPLVGFLFAWHAMVHGDSRREFFYGSPSRFGAELISGLVKGTLIQDSLITGGEALAGFLLGNLFGTLAGLALWHMPFLFRILRPYIFALGTAPLFAFAPIIIIWFGTGLLAKVVIATLSTVFVALMQAYRGADEADPRLLEVVRSLGGGRSEVFRKVIAPASLVWVMAAFRLNIGLALLGSFLGEYISSERGLGHVILVAGGLYNIPLILAAVFLIVVLGWLLTLIVDSMENPLKRLLVRIL